MSSDVKSVNVGTVANDGTGDAIRGAFQTVNSNFANIDNRISTGNYGVVYSGTYVQANVSIASLGPITANTLEVYKTANIAGNVRLANLTVNNTFQATTIVSTANTNILGSLNVTNYAQINKDLVVVGNLTVLGNSVTTTSIDLVIDDSIINIHSPSNLAPLTLDDGKDIGFKFHYFKGVDRHAALVWANDSQSLEFYANGIESSGNVFSGTYGNVKVGSIFLANATQSNDSTSGAIVTNGGIGIAANASIGGNLIVNGNTYLQSANLKQLSVSGTIVGSLYMTGLDTIYINGSPVATSTSTFSGGAVPGVATFGWNGTTVTGAVLEARGNIFANSQVASTSTTTGALVVNGGVGIAGNLNVGGGLAISSIQGTPVGTVTPAAGGFTTITASSTLTTSGVITANNNSESYSVATGAIISKGGLGVTGNIFAGGIQGTPIGGITPSGGNFTTLGATTPGTGVFTTLTATGVFKVNGNIVANSGVDSSSTTTGALVVIGGIGANGVIRSGALVTGNAQITGGSITGGTGQFSTLTATNFSTANAVITGGSVTGINGAATTFIATNFTSSNAQITGGSITGGTGQFSTLTATNFSSGNVTSITGGAGTFVATNFSSGNAQIAGGSITGGTGAFSTLATTNFSSGNAQITGGAISGVTVGGAHTGNAAFTYTTTTNLSTGNAQITGGAITGMTGAFSTLTATNLSSGNLQVSGAITPNANATINLGSTTAWWNNIYGVSSQAKYADLAENYVSDTPVGVGDVVVFGGDAEITTTTEFADTRVAGAISSNPAYLMNADCYQGQPVALRGRIPLNVIGKVAKGDLLVTSTTPGFAKSVGKDKTYGPAVFAKSLNDKDDDGQGQIEAVVL